MQREENSGEILYDLDSAEDWTEAFKDLLDTPIGQEYTAISDPETLKSDKNKILIAVATLNNRSDETGYYASLAQIVQALEKLMIRWRILRTAQEATPLPVPTAPVADTTPRDRNGNPLNASQLAWHEYRIWTDANNSNACRERARREPDGYGQFYHKNLEREFGAQQVGDAVVPAGQSSRKQAPTQELRDFARSYLAERSENLRPKSGLITLAGRQLSYAYLNEMVEKCSQANLL